jgi:hypothetical protein
MMMRDVASAGLILLMIGGTIWAVIWYNGRLKEDRDRELRQQGQAEAERMRKERENEKELARWQQEVAEKASRLVAECERLAGAPAALRGKVLVWDDTIDRLSGVHKSLPPELRAGPSDNPVTVLLICKRDRVHRKSYVKAGAELVRPIREGARAARAGGAPVPPEPDRIVAEGFRVDQRVAIISWPDLKALGSAVVPGDDPPDEVVRPGGSANPILGPTEEPLARWIVERLRAGGMARD